MSITQARLISVGEAAEIVGLSRSKVYELLAEGLLPSIRIGRARRIDMVDLDAFIDRHRIPTSIPATPDVPADGILEMEDVR